MLHRMKDKSNRNYTFDFSGRDTEAPGDGSNQENKGDVAAAAVGD